MSRRMTIDAYLAGEETNLPQKLAFGVLREPAAPGFLHQVIVGRIYERLVRHVRRRDAGRVIISPVDVVLDRERALIVQPGVLYVSTARLGICGDRISGAPDLGVEVLSNSRRRHDRTVKVGWYRQYGVQECWIVDPIARTVEVVDLRAAEEPAVFDDGARIRSAVLPLLRLPVARVFTA
jgi:Uma2 family endonuclease